MKPQYRNHFFVMVLGCLSIIYKCMPHLPDFSPEIILFIYFGARFSKIQGLTSIILVSIISDIAYAYIFDVAVWGSWTFFVYSAYLIIGLAAHCSKISTARITFVLQGLLASFGFWLWTNLEPWWFSGWYAHNASGFLQCYIAALPFLNYSLAAALIWSFVVIAFCKIELRSPLFSL